MSATPAAKSQDIGTLPRGPAISLEAEAEVDRLRDQAARREAGTQGD